MPHGVRVKDISCFVVDLVIDSQKLDLALCEAIDIAILIGFDKTILRLPYLKWSIETVAINYSS